MLLKCSPEFYDNLKIPTIISADDTDEFHVLVNEDLPTKFSESDMFHGKTFGMVDAGEAEKKTVQVRHGGEWETMVLVSGRHLIKRNGRWTQVGGMMIDAYPGQSIEDLLKGLQL